jgi:hypothetical protein
MSETADEFEDAPPVVVNLDASKQAEAQFYSDYSPFRIELLDDDLFIERFSSLCYDFKLLMDDDVEALQRLSDYQALMIEPLQKCQGMVTKAGSVSVCDARKKHGAFCGRHFVRQGFQFAFADPATLEERALPKMCGKCLEPEPKLNSMVTCTLCIRTVHVTCLVEEEELAEINTDTLLCEVCTFVNMALYVLKSRGLATFKAGGSIVAPTVFRLATPFIPVELRSVLPSRLTRTPKPKGI